MIKSILTVVFLFSSACLFAQGDLKKEIDSCTKTIYATYYHKKFEGRKTASGVRYRGEKLTAAHLTLPFGTDVTVTNLSNGKSVTVEVNDRGPHSKKFGIDLSERAAKEIGLYKKGVAKVEIFYTLEIDN